MVTILVGLAYVCCGAYAVYLLGDKKDSWAMVPFFFLSGPLLILLLGVLLAGDAVEGHFFRRSIHRKG